MTASVGNKTEFSSGTPTTGSIVLAADAWIQVAVRTATATGVAVGSSIDGDFGAARTTAPTGDGFQLYLFAKWCTAGTHTITITGTGLSLNAGHALEVLGTSGSGALDKTNSNHEDFSTAPSCTTAALTTQP